MTVDLQQLAVDRSDHAQLQSPVGTRRQLLTRYVLPSLLLLGFSLLIVWASRDFLIPPKLVTVVPVFATQAEAQPADTPLFSAAGWIEPRPTPVRVAALAPGVVEQLLVVEDQPVEAGQPIAELVNDDARLAHDRAVADLDLRDAELDEAKATLKAAITRFQQPVHLEAALGEANAALAKIETELGNLPFAARRATAQREFAQKDYERKLLAKGAIPGRAIDEAKSALDAGNAFVEEFRDREASLENEATALTQRRDALKTQLRLLTDEIRAKEEAEARVKAAEARIAQARVATADAQLQLDRMTVRAPINGRVFRLIGHPGARVGGAVTHAAEYDGSTIVTLYRPDMLQVRVDVRFENIPQVGLGQPVQIENPAVPSPLRGHVLFVSSEADIQKNTLQVKVAIDSPPAVLKPEMLVDVTFLSQERRAESQERTAESQEPEETLVTCIYIPEKLLQREKDGSFVWVADQSAGVARKTAVKTGAVSEQGIEITSGLKLTSKVIASGRNDLEDGDRIRVIGETLD